MRQVVAPPVAHYLAELHRPVDPLLDQVREEGLAAGLPLADVETARLLRALVLATGAKNILEIGTAIGYSAIWLAQALPADGQLITMELSAERAATARDNLERAGLSPKVSVIVGDATRFLHKVSGPFDLIFQDGDKSLYATMLEPLVGLLRPGGVLVTDNVLWNGEVVEGLRADAHARPGIDRGDSRLQRAARRGRAAVHDVPSARRRRGGVGEDAIEIDVEACTSGANFSSAHHGRRTIRTKTRGRGNGRGSDSRTMACVGSRRSKAPRAAGDGLWPRAGRKGGIAPSRCQLGPRRVTSGGDEERR